MHTLKSFLTVNKVVGDVLYLQGGKLRGNGCVIHQPIRTNVKNVSYSSFGALTTTSSLLKQAYARHNVT